MPIQPYLTRVNGEKHRQTDITDQARQLGQQSQCELMLVKKFQRTAILVKKNSSNILVSLGLLLSKIIDSNRLPVVIILHS